MTNKKVKANFSGGDITSDAGVLRLRQIDRNIQLTKSLSRIINAPRDPMRCQHQTQTVLRQRIYSLALGYEDLNDHQ